MTRDEIRKKWQNGEFVGKQSEDNIAEGTTLRPSNQRALNENKNVWQQVMDRTEQMMNTSSNLVQSDQYRISDSRLGRKVGGVLDKVFSGGKATKNFQQKDLVDEKNIRYNGVAARGDRTYNEAGNMFTKREKDYGKGNIDLNNRPVVVDGDGNISTVRSMSFYDEDEGKEVLIPTVVNGRIVSDEEAINHYIETGEYLGKFDTVKEADKYAEELHNQQEKMYGSNIKNKSLFEDAKDIGKAALLGARNVGEKQISYFENMTNEKFKGYRDFQKEAGIRQYLQESGKPLLTAYDKGETKILNEEVSENPTRDTIDSWMNSTEEEIQSIVNRQSNPVTKLLAELTPSMTQSALGTVVKAINPGMNIVYWLTSSGGDYVKSAQQRGITGQAANIYGTLLGSFDAAYEFVGNTITENAFGSGAKGTLKDVLKNMGIGAFENAVEEAVMEPTEEAVAKGFGGEYSFDDLPARMWEAGWKGAVSGAILDAASSGLGKAASIVTKANNKEMITTDDIRDALMEINKNEEYDLEKMLIDNFGTKSLDNLAKGLYNIEGRQEKINKDTKKRMEKVAGDINQDEARKITAKNTEPEEKQATTIENKPLLQQEQQTNQEEAKEAKNENIEQTEEIEGKEEENEQAEQENEEKEEKNEEEDFELPKRTNKNSLLIKPKGNQNIETQNRAKEIAKSIRDDSDVVHKNEKLRKEYGKVKNVEVKSAGKGDDSVFTVTFEKYDKDGNQITKDYSAKSFDEFFTTKEKLKNEAKVKESTQEKQEIKKEEPKQVKQPQSSVSEVYEPTREEQADLLSQKIEEAQKRKYTQELLKSAKKAEEYTPEGAEKPNASKVATRKATQEELDKFNKGKRSNQEADDFFNNSYDKATREKRYEDANDRTNESNYNGFNEFDSEREYTQEEKKEYVDYFRERVNKPEYKKFKDKLKDEYKENFTGDKDNLNDVFNFFSKYNEQLKEFGKSEAKTVRKTTKLIEQVKEKRDAKKSLENDVSSPVESSSYDPRIQQAAQNNEEQGTGTTQRKVNEALEEKDYNEDVETLDTTDMDKGKIETPVQELPQQAKPNNQEPTTEELNDISRQQSNERKQQRKETWQETRDRETRNFFEIDEESWNNLSEESKWGYRNRYKNSSDQEIDSNIRNKSVEKVEQMLEESNKALEEDDVIGILDGEVTAENLEEKDAERKVTARELWEEYKRNELKMNNKNDDLTFVTFDDNRVSSNEDKFNAYLDLVSPERFVSDLKKAVEEKNKADFKDTHGITESVYRKGQNVKDLTTRAELEQIDTALVSNDDVLKARTLDEFGNKDVLSKEDFRKNFNRDISTPSSRNSPMNIEYNRYLDEKLRMLYYDKVNEKYDIDDEFTQKEMRRIRSKETEVRMKRLISDKYKDIVSRLLSGKTNGLGRDLKPTDIEERNVIKNPNGILAPIQRFGKALSYYISTPERINEMEFGHETGKFIQEKVFNPFNKALGDYVKFVQDVVKVVDMFNIRNGTEDSKYLHEIIDGFEYNDEGEQIGAFNEAILRQRLGNDEARINRILEARKIAENLLSNILDRTNAILKANGYSEIPRRKNYMPHYFNERINSIVEYMPKIIGSETQEGAGEALLELFKSTDSSIANEEEDNSVIDQDPSRPTSAHEKARTGTQTETDAVKALKSYAVNMGKLIYFTEHVQNFRALEKLLRQTAQLESTNYADSIYDFDNLTTEEKLKREQIRLTGGFKEYTDWLHSYTNGILGVDTDIKTNNELINTVLNSTSKFMNKVSGRLGPNAVGFNMVTPHTNLIPLAKTIAQTNPISSMKAIGQIAAKRLLGYDDGRMDDSYLWTRRQGIDLNLDSESITQSVRDASMYLMNAYDDFTTEFIVRAKYDEALNNLKKKAKRDGSMADADRIMGQAMDYADDFGSRMLAERTTGRTPLLFNNNFLRPITQFQIEPTNEAVGYLHDMRERYTKDKELFGFSSARSAANIAASGVNMVFLSQVFNNAFEAAFGSRPAIDLMEVIKIALGYDVEPDEDDEEKNKLVSALKYLAGFSEEKNNKDVQKRLSEAGEELWSYMPIINQFSKNARIPTFGAASDIAEGMKDFATNITNEDGKDKAMTGLKTAGKNFGKYFLLPTGGIQANRILETAATFKRGGNYTDSGELRYPVQEQDKTPVRQTQALLFGRKNLPTAKEYNQRYKNSLSGGAKYGKGKLSQEDTELYNSLEGVSYKDFTKVIDNPSSGRMNMLNNIDASESDKWKLFTNKVLSDKQGEKATAVVDNGLATKEEVMNNYEEFKERDISIPNEETINKMKENDISFDLYSKYENDLKNMQDEQDRIKNTTLLLTGKDISKEKDEKDEFNVDTEAKIEVIRNDKYSDDEREKLYTTLVLGNGEENDKKRTKYNDFKKYGTGNSSEINKYLDYVSSGMTKKQELLDWFADNDLTPEQEAYLYATKGYKMTNTYRRILDRLGLKLSDLSGKYKDK